MLRRCMETGMEGFFFKLLLGEIGICLTLFYFIPLFQINETASNSSDKYVTQAGYYCHEKYELYLPFLDQAQFWIEGICLTFIAIIGLLGKCLCLIVLTAQKICGSYIKFTFYKKSQKSKGSFHFCLKH